MSSKKSGANLWQSLNPCFSGNRFGSRFKVVTIGKDAEGNELVDATVDQIQYAKVTGFATYWVAEYGADMDVLLDDKVAALESGEKPCRMKYVKKPIFEIIVPSAKVKKVVTEFISAE